jgi:hypothetical protein
VHILYLNRLLRGFSNSTITSKISLTRSAYFRKSDQSLFAEIGDQYYVRLAKILSILLATIFPSIAIVILYFIPSLLARLGFIMAFSFLLAAVLAVFTEAKSTEIFGITAA